MKCFLAAILISGLVALLLSILPAEAACQWTWDCSDGAGRCRQVPVCDRALDIAPIPSPTIPPIPRPMVPPAGTMQCAPHDLCMLNS